MGRLIELRELTRVRILLFVREPEAVFWVFVFPLVLAGVLGFAFRRGAIPPSRVRVLAGSGAEELVRALSEEPHLEAALEPDRAEAERALRRAAIDALVEPGEPPRLRFDPTRPEASTAQLRLERALLRRAGRFDEIALAREPLQVPGSRYVDFLFPGLLGMNLMSTGLWGIGFAIAEIRQRKVLKRLLVTPMRRSSFFLSFFLSRATFLVLELAVLVPFGLWVLGVPFHGSLASFALVALCGAAAFAGVGLLVAARPRTIQGVSGLLNLVMLPMWLGSGVFFSYERFPGLVQPLLRALPLTQLNDALRAVVLDGRTALDVLPTLTALAAWGVLSFALALRLFRWE
jgi:ABC-type multidrug transport system permease subunit